MDLAQNTTSKITQDITGKKVISNKFGLGEVVGTELLGSGQMFYVIHSNEKNVKIYIPESEELSFRFLSNEKEINKALRRLTVKAEIKSFDSSKDRINYFKTSISIQDIHHVTNLIAELYAIKDKGSSETTIMSNLIDSLSLELSVVLDVSRAIAKEKIHTALSLS